MKRCPNLEDLALYAGDDLDRSQAEELAAHIASCPECSAGVDNFRSDRTLFRSAPQISDAAVAQLHECVLSALPDRTPRPHTWAAAVAACLAAVTVASTQLGRYTEPPAPPPIKQYAMRIPDAVRTITVKQTHRRQSLKSTRASDAALIAAVDRLFEPESYPVAPISGPVVITMQTKDPNVTIILLSGGTGETE
jgi:anti-sigma factor RsiW